MIAGREGSEPGLAVVLDLEPAELCQFIRGQIGLEIAAISHAPLVARLLGARLCEALRQAGPEGRAGL